MSRRHLLNPWTTACLLGLLLPAAARIAHAQTEELCGPPDPLPPGIYRHAADFGLRSYDGLDAVAADVGRIAEILDRVAGLLGGEEPCEGKIEAVASFVDSIQVELATLTMSVFVYARDADEATRVAVETDMQARYEPRYQAAMGELVAAIDGRLPGWTTECGRALNRRLRLVNEYLGECKSAAADHWNTDVNRTYKVNASALAAASPLTANQIVIAIQTAAEYWNAEASSGTLQYRGTEGRTYPWPYPAWPTCQNEGKTWGSIIKDEDGPDEMGDCCWGAGTYCESFLIRLSASCIQSRGAIIDVVGHEFGHAFDIGHPDSGEYALMCNPDETYCNLWYGQRHLRQYDLACAIDKGGERATLPQYRRQYTNGSWGYYTQAPNNQLDIDKMGIGADNVSVNFGYLLSRSDQQVDEGFWVHWFGSITNYIDLGVSFGASEKDGIGPAVAHYPVEYPTSNFFIWGGHADRTDLGCSLMLSPCAGHHLYYARSTDGFESKIVGPMGECRTTGYSSLYPYTCVYPEQAPAIAYRKPWTTRYSGRAGFGFFVIGLGWVWHPEIPELTLTAYLSPDGQSGNHIKIAVGVEEVDGEPHFAHVDTVPIVLSSVAPAIACSDECENGAYRCKLAYVDQYDDDGRISFWPFEINHEFAGATAFRYRIDFDPNGPYRSTHSSQNTAADIALWVNEGTGKYYLISKRENWWQNSELFHQNTCYDSGSGWSTLGTFAGNVVGGIDVTVAADGSAYAAFVQNPGWTWSW